MSTDMTPIQSTEPKRRLKAAATDLGCRSHCCGSAVRIGRHELPSADEPTTAIAIPAAYQSGSRDRRVYGREPMFCCRN
jgi:hypothetical protein